MSFKYKGKLISIPNGYSETDVLKSLQKGKDVYYTSFHSNEYTEYLQTQNFPNRKDIFKKAKDNVYTIEFNLELIIQNVVNDKFYFTIPKHIINDSKIKILIESVWCDLLPTISSFQSNDKIYYNIILNTINKYNLQKDRLCVIGPYENIKDIDGVYYIPFNYFFFIQPPQSEDAFKNRVEEIENKRNKEYKILCLNRKPRRHRLKLFEFALNNNLLENNYHTFACTKKEVQELTQEYYSFLDTDILPYNTDLTGTEYSASYLRIISRPSNINYVDFITETRYEDNGPVMLSEKISLPIINLTPFVYISTPGSLKALKNKGYKTFSKWWSEEYDNIIDNDERLKAICELYKEMTNWTHDEWKNIVYEMKNTLLHNANLYNKHYKEEHLYKDVNNYIEIFNLDK
jgi:hypothetical protein